MNIVAYGWGSDVAGFLVEKASGQTLEQFWYVMYTPRFFSFHHDWSKNTAKSISLILWAWKRLFSWRQTSKKMQLTWLTVTQKVVCIPGLINSKLSNRVTPKVCKKKKNLSQILILIKMCNLIFAFNWLLVRVLLGGAGLYSSMRDYLKLLRHLMQVNGKL